MHKTNGNMSSQHRNELTGQKYTIYPEFTPSQLRLDKLRKTKKLDLRKLSSEELLDWYEACKIWEDWCKNNKHKRDCVSCRRETEAELQKRGMV